MTGRLQKYLSGALRLKVRVASGRVGHHPSGVPSGAKGQVRGRVGFWRVGGEVGGGGEVGHAGQRCLRLVLGGGV